MKKEHQNTNKENPYRDFNKQVKYFTDQSKLTVDKERLEKFYHNNGVSPT